MIDQKKEGMSSLMLRDNKTLILRLNVSSKLSVDEFENASIITLNRRKCRPINIKKFVKLQQNYQ